MQEVGIQTYILIGVFLVGCLGSLVDERVEADEEAHVHHQQHNHPNHYDHYHLELLNNICIDSIVEEIIWPCLKIYCK